MKKNLKLFVDMDGVLADFNAETNAVQRFKTEKGFFKKLKPIKANVKAVKMLLSSGYDVTILTTSPHASADKDKRKWVNKYLGKKIEVIFARPEIAKIDYVKEKNIAVLFDDYGKNIREWVGGGGKRAIKISPNYSILDEIVRGI